MIKIIYIASYGRSGSTVLDALIRKTNPEKFVSVGEVFNIFEKGFKNDEICADNIKFSEHPIWLEVIKKSNYSQKVLREYKFYKNPIVFPFIFIIGLISPKLVVRLFPNYINFFKSLYTNIHQISDQRIVIDSSKDPRHLFLINLINNLDIEVVHIVRDVRATSFSWKKKKIYKPGVFFKRKNILRSSLRWLNDNLWIDVITYFLFKENYFFINYEAMDKIKYFNFFGEKFEINLNNSYSKYNIEIGGNVTQI